MEFEREVLRDILDIAIATIISFKNGLKDIDTVKYTEYINLLLRLDSKVKNDKIIVIGIKD